jgi:hypothetical protein
VAASKAGSERTARDGKVDNEVVGEPTVEELLSDEISAVLLTRDGLEPDHVRTLLVRVSRRRRQAGLAAAPQEPRA